MTSATTRDHVYHAIDTERDYQDRLPSHRKGPENMADFIFMAEKNTAGRARRLVPRLGRGCRVLHAQAGRRGRRGHGEVRGAGTMRYLGDLLIPTAILFGALMFLVVSINTAVEEVVEAIETIAVEVAGEPTYEDLTEICERTPNCDPGSSGAGITPPGPMPGGGGFIPMEGGP